MECRWGAGAVQVDCYCIISHRWKAFALLLLWTPALYSSYKLYPKSLSLSSMACNWSFQALGSCLLPSQYSCIRCVPASVTSSARKLTPRVLVIEVGADARSRRSRRLAAVSSIATSLRWALDLAWGRWLRGLSMACWENSSLQTYSQLQVTLRRVWWASNGGHLVPIMREQRCLAAKHESEDLHAQLQWPNKMLIAN